MEGEGAIGQWKMSWNFDNALKTAEKHSFFKFMLKPAVNSYNRTHIVRVPGPGWFIRGARPGRSRQAPWHRHVCGWSQGARRTQAAVELGEAFASAYLKMKMQEWDDFCGYFSAWEKANILRI